jgi:DNA-binding ferritin-like protein
MSAADIQFFFTMRTQLKLYHWQTHIFSRHKATDSLVETLDDLIDKYVEVYMGKYGRPKVSTKTNSTHVMNMNDGMAARFVKVCIAYLEKPLVKHLKPTDTDLVNIRDEMLAELNQILYLITLK